MDKNLEDQSTIILKYFDEEKLSEFVGSELLSLLVSNSFSSTQERATIFRLYLHKRFFLEDSYFHLNQENKEIFEKMNPLALMILQMELPGQKESIRARGLKNLDDPSSFEFPFDDADTIPPPSKIYLEEGILKPNKDYFYLTQKLNESNVQNLSLNPDLDLGMEFSYSFRFLDMMFLNNTYNMVDQVARAIFDLSKGDLSNL
jgi:hypothetical protein